MADRYRGHYPPSRPASANPARTSLPNGIGYQPSYADDAYLAPSSSRHPVTTPRGYTSSTNSSGQPTTTRTYAVTQDPRSRTRPRDHSRTRRSTMDSAPRPPVIVTTTQNDRSQNHLIYGPGGRNGSPVRDEYRAGDSQYYAMPASSKRSRSSARPYHDDNYPRHRDRGDGLLSAHDADSHRQPRHSTMYPNNPRHNAAAIDYGDEGYKYTNAGELVRYDLDHSKPSRSRRHDSFDRDYYRPKATYAGSHRRDGARYDGDRGYITSHGRHGGYGGPPPSTRGFDKINRDYDTERDRQTLPAAPKPPKPLPHADTTGNLRDGRDMKHSRPVSISQEPPYRDNSYRNRDDYRDRRDPRDHSLDRESGKRRPNSTQFYDESISNRGFGIRTEPEAPSSSDRRERGDHRRGDYPPSTDNSSYARRAPQDRPLSFSGEERYPDNERRDTDKPVSHSLLDSAGTGLGITAAAAGLAAARREQDSGNRASDLTEHNSRASPESRLRAEPEAGVSLSPQGATDLTPDQPKSQVGPAKLDPDSSFGTSENGGTALVKEGTQPASSDSDDVSRGRVSRKERPSRSFNPNDTGDLRQIRDQLAALRVQDSQREPSSEQPLTELERRPRSLSPVRDAPSNAELGADDEKFAVGFPVEKKHARVVSPPRDKRDDKPLRGILKQPSAKFPEDANPIREGVAPHKEDKKLKEVPPGARWTKINRKVVNPEALTIGKERFEERDDFVIVLRVLSKEEIQAYAAATQVLRERRRNREGEEDHERRHNHDDDDGRRHDDDGHRRDDDGRRHDDDGHRRDDDGRRHDDDGHRRDDDGRRHDDDGHRRDDDDHRHNDDGHRHDDSGHRHHRHHRRHDEDDYDEGGDSRRRDRERDSDGDRRPKDAQDDVSEDSGDRRRDGDRGEHRSRRSRRHGSDSDSDERRRDRGRGGDRDRDTGHRRRARDDDDDYDEPRGEGDRRQR